MGLGLSESIPLRKGIPCGIVVVKNSCDRDQGDLESDEVGE